MADPRARIIITAEDKASAAIKGIEARAAGLSRAFGSLRSLLPVAGFASLGVAIRGTVTEADKAERQMLKLEQLVRATGGAAGLTAAEIDTFSRSLARSTLASTEGVRDAASALLTFRSVSGETFKRTLELAQDLSSTFKTDLKSAVVQLGKALEDPATGLSALRESGVSFTEAEKDLIKSLQAAGRELEAQSLILDKLDQQVGGAGAAESGGLAGKVDTLSQSWSEFLENIGNAGPLQAAADFIQGLSDRIDTLNRLLFQTEQDRFYELSDRRAELLQRLERAQGRTGQSGRQASAIRAELREIEQEMRALQDRNIARQTAARDAEVAAEKAKNDRIVEQAEAAQKKLTDQRKKDAAEAAKKESARLDALAATLQQPYDKLYSQLSDIDTLLEQGKISADEYAEAFFDAFDKVAESVDPVKEEFDDLRNTIEGWGRDFADTLLEGEGNFSSFVDSIVNQLARIVLSKTFDPAFSKFGDFVAETIPKIFANADGNVFPSVAGYSNQIVNRPTLFKFADGGAIGLMGEAGAEAVMPLARDASGRLGVKAYDTSANVDIVVTVENHGQPLSVTSTQETKGPDGEKQIRILVENSVTKMIGEGRLDRAMRSNYGLSRVGVPR